MADFSFDNKENEAITSENIVSTEQPVDSTMEEGIQEADAQTISTPSVDDSIVEHDAPSEVPSSKGLSSEELNDPNAINVTIADANTPILILFGPPACGKTMTLVRLTRFLQREGYTVTPIKSFRPDYDENYKYACDNFDQLINSTDAATSTSRISFMLIRVMYQGRTLCQILEAPGEYYFDPRKPNAPFPNYVYAIISRSNRKIWAFMVEPDWKNQVDRNNYVTRINNLKTRLRPRDKALFVFNKIDKTPFVISPGNINKGQALGEVKNLYPGIFERFRNVNPLTKWLWEYNFDFAPFQTGDYSQLEGKEKMSYQEGPDEYPRMLWGIIMKRIRG